MKKLAIPLITCVVLLAVLGGAWLLVIRDGVNKRPAVGALPPVISYSSVLPPRMPAATKLKELADPISFVEERMIGGAGLLIASSKSGYPEILGIAEKGPADVVGMKAGGFISSVDGKSTKGMDLGDVKKALAGPIGSTVKLVVEIGSVTSFVTLKRVAVRELAALPIDTRH